jgi:hypothetical protein
MGLAADTRLAALAHLVGLWGGAFGKATCLLSNGLDEALRVLPSALLRLRSRAE